MSFTDLGLSDPVLRAIGDAGYSEPTPIQEQAIPHVLTGRDIMGCAQTGTGKTASFTLPMIDILAAGRAKARMPRSLIMEPTRELAAQVAESFETYGKYNKLTMALLIGGVVVFEDQERKLDRGVDVLIATPGRLLDHVRARQGAARRRQGAGDRRGRPHARHGLHSRRRAHRRADAEDPPDPVLLRHHAARKSASLAARRFLMQSEGSQRRAAGNRRRDRRTVAGHRCR